MNYNRLGKSGILISEVSMGCMSLNIDEPEKAAKLIHTAIDLGINFFDTADLYDQGRNEALVGTAINGKREDVVIATKVGNQWNEKGTSWSWNPRKAYILSAVEESLKRLNTDYIDLYQLHGGTLEDPIEEIIETFEFLKEQGKIRSYGISSIRPNVIREYIKRSNIDSVMMQYSLLDRRPEEVCLDLLGNHGISVITRGTLAKGLLAGKPAQPYLDHSTDQVKAASDAIKAVAHKMNQPECATACQYVLQSPAVASAVIGFRTLEQLLGCITRGNNLTKLETVDLKILQESTSAYIYESHR
ncbi:MAG: aldo/keto reductase [Saprospiraceae bacterium]|nr:aldo/keto reductase [Saprospiraceae bacterium]MCB9325153.1 aldo/keto reductase [Lewinellaceae bacterium]